jgi:hypothetical protein
LRRCSAADEDLSAGRQERLGDSSANSFAAAGNKHNLSFNGKHHNLRLLLLFWP